MDDIELIRERLSREVLLCQLAEEAAELAQAALKLRRALVQDSPTPVTEQEAFAGVLEEVADVSNCLEWLGVDTALNSMAILRVKTKKRGRLMERLWETEQRKEPVK